MAAKGGNVEAQRSLASLYEKGEGTEKNIKSAVYWYKKAVKNECKEAKKKLDILLSEQASQNLNVKKSSCDFYSLL